MKCCYILTLSNHLKASLNDYLPYLKQQIEEVPKPPIFLMRWGSAPRKRSVKEALREEIWPSLPKQVRPDVGLGIN